MKKFWRQKEPIKDYKETDSVIDKLIAVNNIEDRFRFLYPTEDELHSPYLLKNIEPARDRIIVALENKQKISIFVDNDPDGISSTALLFQYLNNYSDNVTYFHTQRSVGHGIQYALELIPSNTDLLIIVDSSSNEWESCRLISEQGMDIIVIDHHLITDKNDYCILVNPQQESCQYPNKQSSGSLLTWKVCQTLDEYFHENYSDSLIDLAAFGLYSDIQCMKEYENRFMVNHMLDNVQNIGLRSILKVIGKEKEKLYSSTFGYNITPFINAPTRLDKIELPLKLLTTEDPILALKLAKEIKILNEERKKFQKEAVGRLRPLVNEQDKCIVLVDSSLGKGYNGLVANDLSSIYQRPVIIQGESDMEYAGSFRSYGDFDFLKFVSELELVTNCGGHAGAGGISFKKTDIDRIKLNLNSKLKNEKFEQMIEYDFELKADEINEKIITQVQDFCRVSGTGFNEAKFLIKDLIVIQKKILGSGEDTLKLGCLIESDTYFMDDNDFKKAKSSLVIMKFKADENFKDKVKIGDKIDVVGSLNLNLFPRYKPKYHIEKTKQIFIEDLRIIAGNEG
ncbi:DHH family phosphoesterase [Paenibacillus sp. GCM10027627]|uniref:single-stranded-DNA-specific exonuclease RecJ n=1 Tax=unclassified Paenibacillus TaxID=185978 RepID=UPI00362D39ED